MRVFQIISIMFLVSLSLWSYEVTAELKSKAVVASDGIYLSDVAELFGSVKDIELLSRQRITDAPDVGTVLTLSQDKIKMRLRQNGMNHSMIEWNGPKKIQVSSEGLILKREETEKLLAKEILLKYQPDNNSRVREVEVSCVPRQINIPGKTINYQVKVDFLKNSGEVTLLLYADSKEMYKREFSFKISEECRVYQAVRDIPKGECFKLEDYELRWSLRRKGNFLPGQISETKDFLGCVSQKHIRKDDFLIPQLYDIPQMVESGLNVNVVVIKGNVSIQTSGIAMKDGRKGESIQVRLPNRNVIFGVVEDFNKVVIR